jgi:uncharacterized membrane protein
MRKMINSICTDLVFCALLWLVFGWQVMLVTVAVMAMVGLIIGIYLKKGQP